MLSKKIQATPSLIRTYFFEDLVQNPEAFLRKDFFVIPTQQELFEVISDDPKGIARTKSFADLKKMDFEYGILEEIKKDELVLSNGNIHKKKTLPTHTYLVGSSFEETKALLLKRQALIDSKITPIHKQRGYAAQPEVSEETQQEERLEYIFNKYQQTIPDFIDRDNLNKTYLAALERALKLFKKDSRFPLMERLKSKSEINKLQKRLAESCQRARVPVPELKRLSWESDEVFIGKLKEAIEEPWQSR